MSPTGAMHVSLDAVATGHFALPCNGVHKVAHLSMGHSKTHHLTAPEDRLLVLRTAWLTGNTLEADMLLLLLLLR